MNPNAIIEGRRTKVPRALMLLAGLVAGLTLALLAFGAQSASAGSGGMGPGGAAADSAGSSAKGNHMTPSKYHRLWSRVPRKEKRWASNVAECETGKDPNMTAMQGEYRGAFMFLQETWDNAPKTPGGDPIDYTYKVQAVVAVALKKQLGTGPWPVCG
ncbi:MAG: transglycosylase family protein [Solirubrobacterales bacterium]|nr:transglycosylase family protein [Solirubrobacterales bacterium]MCB8970812.1 transglycosylase family protein [Thermoleophilales bacterium]MCO5327680.1 transglycosylase family protein [Solirubrobacterales bacterium]